MSKPEPHFTRHGDERALERLGIKLSRADRLCLVHSIESGNSKVIESRYTDASGRTLEKWLVPWQGGHIPVAFDPIRRWIVTVLPRDYTPLRQNLGDMLRAVMR